MKKKELDFILQEGEGFRIEFKEALSGLDRELVAFANSSGGKVFIGVSDDKKVKGIKITNSLKSQIQNIANHCQPVLEIFFEEMDNILVVNVKEGQDKPYKCSSGFFTRIGPNAQKLNRDEIIQFIKAEGKVRFDELVNSKFDFTARFAPKKLDRFLRLAGLSNTLDVSDTLINLGTAEKQADGIILNNTGVLFFASNLADTYRHTAVTCALYQGNEKVEVLDRKDFNDDLISSIDDAMNFLKQHLAVRYEMTGAPRRREVPEIPFAALREAVVNAVAHRDYFEKGANVMIEIFDDRVEISNPGGLPKGLDPENFGKKSVLRNPSIADLLHRADYIEKMGTGINKIRKLILAAGLKPPRFEFNTFFTVIFERPVPAGRRVEGLVERLVEGLVENQAKIMRSIRDNPAISINEIAKKLKISTTAVDKNILALKKKGLLKRVGPDKGGHWKIIK